MEFNNKQIKEQINYSAFSQENIELSPREQNTLDQALEDIEDGVFNFQALKKLSININNEIALYLIDTDVSQFFKNFKLFRGLNKKVFKTLVLDGHREFAQNNIAQFSGLEEPDLNLVGDLQKAGENDLASQVEEEMVIERTIKGKFRALTQNKDTEALRDFKKDLASYKQAWARIISGAVEFLREKPYVSENDFLSWFDSIAQSVNLNSHPLKNDNPNSIAIPKERLEVQNVFTQYQEEQEKIKELRQKHHSDNELFSHL